jgi:hypothetical protein
VPALDDRPAVDRQQIAVREDVGGRGDAVHDLFVHRRTDRRRVAVVAEERRHTATIPDHLLGNHVELAGAHAGPGSRGDGGKGPGDERAGDPHGVDLDRGLELDVTATPAGEHRTHSAPCAAGHRAPPSHPVGVAPLVRARRSLTVFPRSGR